MKLASFEIGNSSTWGVIENDEALDVGALLRDRYPDLKSAIAGDALPAVREASQKAKRYPAAGIIWLPVIPNPDKILCIGLNYETHRKETGRTEVENPTVFGRFANSQTGASSPTLSGQSSRMISTSKANSRSSSENRAGISLAPIRGATSPATPATTKAVCVIFNAIRINSRRARTFRGPALSVLG